MNEHLKENGTTNFVSWADRDGFVTASMLLMALFFNAISVIIFANSLGQVVGLLFFELLFEAGAIPAGISVFTKNPYKNRKAHIALIVTWEVFVLLIIVALLLTVRHCNWPYYATYIFLFVFTLWAVAWEAICS